MPALPLAGVRVVERARSLATRYAGFLLADLGAPLTSALPEIPGR